MTEAQLQQLIKNDPIYQEILSMCQSLEADYIRIRQVLPDADQEILDNYIALCEEMEYRRTFLALNTQQT